MDVYKLDMKRMKLSKISIPVLGLVNRTINDARSLASEKGVEIQYDMKYKGNVLCDPYRIDQVLMNLLENSIDFVKKNLGKITIAVEQLPEDEGKIVFTVTDNGIGIPGIPVPNLTIYFRNSTKQIPVWQENMVAPV